MLTNFIKRSIADVWLGSEYTSEFYQELKYLTRKLGKYQNLVTIENTQYNGKYEGTKSIKFL